MYQYIISHHLHSIPPYTPLHDTFRQPIRGGERLFTETYKQNFSKRKIQLSKRKMQFSKRKNTISKRIDPISKRNKTTVKIKTSTNKRARFDPVQQNAWLLPHDTGCIITVCVAYSSLMPTHRLDRGCPDSQNAHGSHENCNFIHCKKSCLLKLTR